MTDSTEAHALPAQPLSGVGVKVDPGLLPSFAAAALPVILACALGPWWSVFQFDTDEGLCLIKSVLTAEGWWLYREVWSDQPPFLTLVQAAAFKLFEPGVALGRAVVLGFAALLAFSLFRIVARQAGVAGAWAAVVVLVVGGLFARLSVSSMIGLPSVALATAAMAVATAISGPGDQRRLVISGALTALSLATKLFSAPVVVAIGLVVMLRTLRFERPVDTLKSAIMWGGTVVLVFVAVMAPFGENVIEQLFHSHVTARGSDSFRHLGGPYHLWVIIKQYPQYPLLGIAGIAAVLGFAPGLRRYLVPPILWLALALAALIVHQPIWYHHLMLLHVPLAWLAGLGAAAAFSALKGESGPEFSALGRRIPAVVFAVAAIISFPTVLEQLNKVANDFRIPPAEADVKAVESLLAYKDKTRWVLTDYPIDTVRAGMLSVPPAAVYPSKRLKSGNLSQEALLRYIREFQPEQVSYRRFFMGKSVKSYLDDHYVRLEGNPEQLHYVLPELLGGAEPSALLQTSGN